MSSEDKRADAQLSEGKKAELELRRHFEGRRAGQRIKVSLPVEVVCLERNVAARTIDISRTGALLHILEGGEDRNLAELMAFCEEIDRLFQAGGTIDFDCGPTRTMEAVRATAGGLGGKTVPMLACRFKEPLTADDFQALGVPVPNDDDVPNDVDGGPAPVIEIQRDPAAVKRKVPAVQELLRWAVAREATDIHIKAGSPPRLRVGTTLEPVSEESITASEARNMVRNFLTDAQWEEFEAKGDLDVGFALEGVARFRINVLRTRNSICMVMRRIPLEVPRLDELNLAEDACRKLCGKKRGLVLVTGGSGSGKSTTLAAMLRHINETRPCHIVTLEDPIEYIHQEIQAQVTQREVGTDTEGFHAALKRVLRQDPDVIMVGEMRDLETIQMAVTAAETGHLVFATLHTTSAAQTVDRIVDVFPAEAQRQIRVQLASTLQGIICQTLVPKRNGGVTVAQEILAMTDAVRALLRDGKTMQLRNVMQTGGSEGMQMLEDSLNKLIAEGVLEYETALDFANVPSLVRKTVVKGPPKPPSIPAPTGELEAAEERAEQPVESEPDAAAGPPRPKRPSRYEPSYTRRPFKRSGKD